MVTNDRPGKKMAWIKNLKPKAKPFNLSRWMKEAVRLQRGKHEWFHATFCDLVPKIQRNGLKPGKGGWFGPGIYLWDDLEVAADWAETAIAGNGVDVCILRVETDRAVPGFVHAQALNLDPTAFPEPVLEDAKFYAHVALVPGRHPLRGSMKVVHTVPGW